VELLSVMPTSPRLASMNAWAKRVAVDEAIVRCHSQGADEEFVEISSNVGAIGTRLAGIMHVGPAKGMFVVRPKRSLAR